MNLFHLLLLFFYINFNCVFFFVRMVKNFSVLVACTLKNGIGIEGKMAWYIKEDLNMFQKKTTNQVVVMGRNTFLSLPASQRPLKNRINIVVSRSWLKMENKDQQPENVIVVNCLNDALKHAKDFYSDREIFVIGGSHLYETAFDHFACKDIYLTQVFDDIACTVFMQPFDSSKFEIMDPIQPIQKSESKGNLTYQMRHYQRKHEEYQYLNLIRKTMNITNVRMDRTEIGTYSTFGNVMKFSLRNNQFPLLTTKNVFFRGVVEELLWIMRGETNSKTLNAKRVCIWDKDGSQSNGDLGPIYGHQWRHAGAKYPLKNNNNNANLDKLQTIIQDLELSTFIEDLRKDLNYVGIDQLKKLIHDLRTDPSSRRMVTSSWNVKDIDAMALPPCHIMFQMKINYANELSCLMFQRSGFKREKK